jgi:hypothetical protein
MARLIFSDYRLLKIISQRHRRLLRARRERPRGRRAAEQRDEIAAPQLVELHSISNSPRQMQDIE